MKKSVFFSAMVLLFLCSCSSKQSEPTNNNQQITQTQPQKQEEYDVSCKSQGEVGSLTYIVTSVKDKDNPTIPKTYYGGAVVEIGNQACQYKTNIKTIVIPDNITVIGSYAFTGCRYMTSITLPKTLKKLGEGAFNSCSSLKTIVFEGTKSQWEAIVKPLDGYPWHTSSGLQKVQCSDGDIAYDGGVHFGN